MDFIGKRVIVDDCFHQTYLTFRKNSGEPRKPLKSLDPSCLSVLFSVDEKETIDCDSVMLYDKTVERVIKLYNTMQRKSYK